jgi:anti-sigma factor ChrR (cupin superfamily)
MQEVYVNCNEMEWVPAANYPQGTLIKILRDFGGKKTVLLKMPAGFKVEKHSHNSIEQHYVIEGEYKIEDSVYGQGTYQLLPAGYEHGPFTSEEGATLLIIWDPQ